MRVLLRVARIRAWHRVKAEQHRGLHVPANSLGKVRVETPLSIDAAPPQLCASAASLGPASRRTPFFGAVRVCESNAMRRPPVFT